MNLLILLDEGFDSNDSEIIEFLKGKHKVEVLDIGKEDVLSKVENYNGLKVLFSKRGDIPEELMDKLNYHKTQWLILTTLGYSTHKNYLKQEVNFISLPPYPCSYLNTKNHSLLHLAIDILTWCVEKLKIKERSLEILSKKENEVVNLLLQGLDDKEISRKLFISDKTVRNHISNILQKVGLRNRTQLVLWALQQIGKIEQLS